MTAKRVLLIVIVVIVGLALIEIFNLLQLKANIHRYATYWQEQTSKSGDFTYVALGDSAAQGLGASAPQKGYVGLLAQQIAATTGKNVRIVNLSVSGAQIQDVLNKQLPELKNYKPDLLTVEIGANNVTHWDEATFTKQYTELAAALPPGTIVANIPYFGGRIRLNTQAITASQIIARIAVKYDLKVVDLQTYTRQRQSIFNYSSDLFHPSNRGYRNWAAAFWLVVSPSLSDKH
jgi:lysophospholipase L1-like esterase